MKSHVFSLSIEDTNKLWQNRENSNNVLNKTKNSTLRPAANFSRKPHSKAEVALHLSEKQRWLARRFEDNYFGF
jgi:hypothetical protein